MGLAEGAPDRMIDKDGAWRHDLAHDVEGRTDDERWNASTLDDVGNETDGLVAKGSVGNEQREIDPVPGQISGDGRRKIILDFLGPAHASHERNVKRRKAADGPVLR